jgi:hypothetical protein
MLFQHRPEPSQIRHRCRNPRCAGKLELPASNRRDAFCCKGCERQFYGCRCRVCEALSGAKTSRRVVCARAKCQSAFRRHPEDFFGTRYPYRGVTDNAQENSAKSKLKTGMTDTRTTYARASAETVSPPPRLHSALPFRCRALRAAAAKRPTHKVLHVRVLLGGADLAP